MQIHPMIRATCWVQASVIPIGVVSVTPDGGAIVRSVGCFLAGGTRKYIPIEFRPLGIR